MKVSTKVFTFTSTANDCTSEPLLQQALSAQLTQALPQRRAGAQAFGSHHIRSCYRRLQLPPMQPPAQQRPPGQAVGASHRQFEGHGIGRKARGLEPLTPLGHAAWLRCRIPCTVMPAPAQLQPLRQQLVLPVRQLQPFGQSQGIGGTSHQGHKQRQPQAPGPAQAAAPAPISLKLPIQQDQGAPALQGVQGLKPGFARQQQLQLHAQPRTER